MLRRYLCHLSWQVKTSRTIRTSSGAVLRGPARLGWCLLEWTMVRCALDLCISNLVIVRVGCALIVNGVSLVYRYHRLCMMLQIKEVPSAATSLALP